jgi:hypothetical protein
VGSLPDSTLLRWKYQFQVNVMNLNLVRKIFNFMKSVAFCKSFYYIYNVIDYFPGKEFKDFAWNMAIIRIVKGFAPDLSLW